ncbi:MAG: hypothetical protein M3O31_09115 [Acidobacteriota bacterium]|nr:hypothetical protein [Acidobacteriota bacterium]
MTARKCAPRSSNTRRNHGEQLKDEVYRQMFRLEAGRPGAHLALLIALLRGWLASSSEPGVSELSEWLKKICPICLRMIEATQLPGDIGQQRVQ